MTCHFCRRPLTLRSCIRPGGLPFFWRDCDCDEAELARPLWSASIRSFADVVAWAGAFPRETAFMLARCCA
jgi:hypothetical protein